MGNRDLEFDPMDYYHKVLKEEIKKNAADFFDQHVKNTKTNVEECRENYKKLKAAIEKDKANEKRLSFFKGLRTFLIVLIIIGVVSVALGIFLLVKETLTQLACILMICIGAVVVLICILVITLKLNKLIKELKELDKKHDEEVSKYNAICLSGLYPLCDSFHYDDFIKIARKTTTAFELDEVLKPEKLLLLAQAYGYNADIITKDESVMSVTSGGINKNPFLRVRLFNESVYDETYVGHLTITWTEWVGSGKDRHAVTRSETLTATVTAPAPHYSVGTYVIYGNNAAPDLKFSRKPSGLSINASDSTIEKFVKSKFKDMQKDMEKNIREGGSMQLLANEKFEALFGCTDRNNEVQYRLLFTPLAQQNLCELITNKDPYGDDFSFFKIFKINIVSSLHGKNVPDYDHNMFYGKVDFDGFRDEFINTIKSIFDSLYFELAPLLSIPLYQTRDAGDYSYSSSRHVSDYEAESMVNHMDGTLFTHPETTTPHILKVNYERSSKGSDIFSVTAKSWRGENRVTFIPQLGGDGFVHEVPVHWVEYFPLEKESHISVRNTQFAKEDYRNLMDEKEIFQTEKEKYRNICLYKNMLGFVTKDGYNYLDEEDDMIASDLERFRNRKEKI